MQATIVRSRIDPSLEVTAYSGHFATRHSHNSHYIDVTRIKHEHAMAYDGAAVLAQKYVYVQGVDTVVCLDGSQVLGAFLAHHLAQKDVFSVNCGKNINVVTPEHDSNSQLIFRENLIPMIRDRDVLLLISIVNSGKTARRALECIEYYGGRTQAIASIFGVPEQVGQVPVYSLYTPADIPGYFTHTPDSCPLCREGRKLDALSNSYGFSLL